jgi:hypothetical protein
MTPKEKAIELVDKFMDYTGFEINENNNMSNVFSAKQCALIAVDEILESHYKLLSGVNPSVYKYLQELKQEIEKL